MKLVHVSFSPHHYSLANKTQHGRRIRAWFRARLPTEVHRGEELTSWIFEINEYAASRAVSQGPCLLATGLNLVGTTSNAKLATRGLFTYKIGSALQSKKKSAVTALTMVID
jgi:hypothetical protein